MNEELLDKLSDMLAKVMLEKEDVPLDVKVSSSLALLSTKIRKLMVKIKDGVDLDKVYEQQFNTIIHYSKVLINEINEIIGDENE